MKQIIKILILLVSLSFTSAIYCATKIHCPRGDTFSPAIPNEYSFYQSMDGLHGWEIWWTETLCHKPEKITFDKVVFSDSNGRERFVGCYYHSGDQSFRVFLREGNRVSDFYRIPENSNVFTKQGNLYVCNDDPRTCEFESKAQ